MIYKTQTKHSLKQIASLSFLSNYLQRLSIAYDKQVCLFIFIQVCHSGAS